MLLSCTTVCFSVMSFHMIPFLSYTNLEKWKFFNIQQKNNIKQHVPL